MKTKRSNSTQGGNKISILRIVALFAFALLIAVISALGTYFFVLKKNAGIAQIMEKTVENKSDMSSCNQAGILPKSDYLPTYTVKKGDSLLSIAQNVLKDKSRVSELVTLNKENYPELSLSNPFIEQGWTIVLPPEGQGKTNGNILVVAGTLSVSDQGWGVGWTNSGVGPFPLADLPSDLVSRDCVIVVYQGNDPVNFQGMKVFSVKKQ